MAQYLVRSDLRGQKERTLNRKDVINIMYSYLQSKTRTMERVYEALYYLDQLKKISAKINGWTDKAVNNGKLSKSKNVDGMGTKSLSVEKRNILLERFMKLLELFPRDLKTLLFGHKSMEYLKKVKCKVNANKVFKSRYRDELEYRHYTTNADVLSGIELWLVQMYFSVAKMLPKYTYEEFVSAVLTIMSGNHTAVDESLLSALLYQESFCFLVQNKELQTMDISTSCLVFANYVNALSRCIRSENNNLPRVPNNVVGKRKQNYTPAMASQVTVMSFDEKKLQKRLNKKQKKNKSDKEIKELEEDLEKEQMKPLFHRVSEYTSIENYESYPHVHMENSGGRSKGVICGKLMVIPSDSVRRVEDKYEEITIAARKRATERTMPPVKINQLDPIGKMVFQEIEEFNEIQSEVFPVAYLTNENMLICAPTGAGKTNIALMTIVHQIKNFVEDKVLHLEKFKIVYICPMKALAAEITRKFSQCLGHLGVRVKEVSGDMQLSRKEIMETQILVTTPEKWDVITRKGAADSEMIALLKLLILDEVHLLNSDRGPVIEALVARTLRQVVSSQCMIRIVGLSATIPNILDVADFLKVNRHIGLFYFDQGYKSVPISQTFVGIKATRPDQVSLDEDEACFEKVKHFLRQGHQVMVFVHARTQTVKYANYLKENAGKEGVLDLFRPESVAMRAKKFVLNCKTAFLKDLYQYGLGVHHAGMLRMDRNDVERAFLAGAVRVLVCTATLAWGVNLPAHAVIIKGTTVYDTKRSAYVDIDILDVMQIFGRAGRPQFDTSGSAVLITSQPKIVHYLRLITLQVPIESQFLKSLNDNLNAEVVLGTVSTVQEAVEWITYTYFYLRLRNTRTFSEMTGATESDPVNLILSYVHKAAKRLDSTHMLRYNEETGDLIPTNLGRTASYFYINVDTMEHINELIMPNMSESEILRLMCKASEFEQIQVRQEELSDLDNLLQMYCEFDVYLLSQNREGKVNILMQTYISKGYITCLSLAADMEYITQSAQRIARALFDIALHKAWPTLASKCLLVSQMFEHRLWPYEHVLKQLPDLPPTVTNRLEERNVKIDALREMDEKEVGNLIRNYKYANRVKRYADAFPMLLVETRLQPITRGVVRVKLFVRANFKWTGAVHGDGAQIFWVWVEDPDCNNIYHSESFTVTKAVCTRDDLVELVFTVPLTSPPPFQYLVRISSDRWMGAVQVEPITFADLKLPESFIQHTSLLPLQPLEVKVLDNQLYESLYRFTHFNPVQTQIFHCLYHGDSNVLLGAPTGSGKTIAAELCMFRLFNTQPDLKVVYIAPLKALVRERVLDWKKRFAGMLGKTVVEITGDVTAGYQLLQNSDIIITTPEKWDAMSRGWQDRNYVRDVGLMIIDEIHLLGEERGPVLEVIVSRTNFICDRTGRRLRIVGLSTAMANAGDLAIWLGIGEVGLYNFQPSVRPVPLNVHITGFPGKHYCPRMMSMNRPAYQAIRQYAPDSPTLIFCSSRKQTRLTAFALITYLLTDSNPKQWLKCDAATMEMITANDIQDPDLKHFLNFGIGIHHAGLQEKDRNTVEELYVNHMIQVLISTSTLAWGVNFPSHLVIIKGTEYYDGNLKRYVDMPITDILQMMGRAGRPQFDTSGVACVFVHDLKKNFYKKFLYEPFPVESNLLEVLPDHVNAEIVAGTVPSKIQLLEYLTWTYLFKRLHENPSYYSFNAEVNPRNVNAYLTALVDRVIATLQSSRCVLSEIGDDCNCYYEPTFLGTIACYYYLSHKTVYHFSETLKRDSSTAELIEILSFAQEYALFPVRHNEDKTNQALATALQFRTNIPMDSPHLKVLLLIYAYLGDLEPPTREYMVDTKSVLDQALRILQGMLDVAADSGWLSVSLRLALLSQMILQGRWLTDSCLAMLPRVRREDVAPICDALEAEFGGGREWLSLPGLKRLCSEQSSRMREVFAGVIGASGARDVERFLVGLPVVTVKVQTVEEDATEIQHTIHLNDGKMYGFTAGALVEFKFQLSRRGDGSLEVHSNKFTKQKEESWLLVVGLPEEDVLLASKKLSFRKQKSTSVKLKMPSKKGDYMLCLYLLSDSYIGLDQQYLINVTVI